MISTLPGTVESPDAHLRTCLGSTPMRRAKPACELPTRSRAFLNWAGVISGLEGCKQFVVRHVAFGLREEPQLVRDFLFNLRDPDFADWAAVGGEAATLVRE